MKTIDVYGTPECSMCSATKKWLTMNGLAYNDIDISKDPEAEDRCRAFGYKELPVVVAGERHWSGFRHAKLKELLS